MSIASEISRLQTAKTNIKTAIEAKGVTVPSSATIDTYDDYVSQISGGGSGISRVTSGTPYCTGTNLYVDVTTDISIDGGASWVESGVTTILVESGSSQCIRIPTGYTEVEYIKNTGTTTTTCAYINTGLKLYDIRGNSFSISGRVKSEYYGASGYNDLETIINSEGVSSPYYGFVYRYAHSTHVLELSSNPSNSVTLSTTANSDGSNSIVINCNSTTVTDQVPLGLFASYNGNYTTPYRFAKAAIYSLTVTKNGDIVRDFVPAKRDSDSVYGLYDVITDTFYTSPNGNNFIGGSPV